MSAITRRMLTVGAVASAAITAGASAVAQPAPAARQKGPPVWLDMDQKELDDAYDQRVYAPNADQILRRCDRNSELVRERLGAPKRLAYGPTPIEGLDEAALSAARSATFEPAQHCGKPTRATFTLGMRFKLPS